MRPMHPAAAVIDIGSNSLKALVARRDSDGSVATVMTHAIEARISVGISHAAPRLSPEGMQRGLEAITELLRLIEPHQPRDICLVATSAVRDAANGHDFQNRVQSATGYAIRVLSGSEEADLIGRGLMCDPALPVSDNFYNFDLGGGSLECLAFAGRRLQSSISLQLGCVRLTEKYIPDPEKIISPEIIAAIAAHTTATLAACPFEFTLPADSATIATGGTITTVRGMLAARDNSSIEDASALITVETLRQLATEVSALDLAARSQLPGLPAGRADVFPAALATLLGVAASGGFAAFHHSFYNLRYGLADEMLPS